MKHTAARFKAGVSGAHRCVVIANNHADVTSTSANVLVSPVRHIVSDHVMLTNSA